MLSKVHQNIIELNPCLWYIWKWSCTIWLTLCDYHHKSLTKPCFWYMWKWSCTSWFTLCDYHHKSLTKERLRARSCTHWLYYTGYVFLVALAFTVYRHHHRIVVLWPPVAQYSAYSTLGLSSSLLLLRLENLYFIHGTQEGWKSEMLWWGHLKNVLVDEITQPYIILTLVLGNYGFKCLPFWEGEGA